MGAVLGWREAGRQHSGYWWNGKQQPPGIGQSSEENARNYPQLLQKNNALLKKGRKRRSHTVREGILIRCGKNVQGFVGSRSRPFLQSMIQRHKTSIEALSLPRKRTCMQQTLVSYSARLDQLAMIQRRPVWAEILYLHSANLRAMAEVDCRLLRNY